jgi:hypothetical protein
VGRASRLKKEKRKLLELLAEVQAARPIQTNQTGIWHRIPLVGKAAFGFALAVATLLGVLPVLLTNISVEGASSPSPNGQFIVKNEGTLPINNVLITCKYKPIYDPKEKVNVNIYESVNHIAVRLEAGEPVTALCRMDLVELKANHLLQTLVDLDISYRPAFGLWNKHKSRSFTCYGFPPTNCAPQPLF